MVGIGKLVLVVADTNILPITKYCYFYDPLVSDAMLHDLCHNDTYCQLSTNHTVCMQVTPTASYCKCAAGYQLKEADMTKCIQIHPPISIIQAHPLVSLVLVLTVLAALLCLVTRLFARARWAPAR